jgi:hypothetical protein
MLVTHNRQGTGTFGSLNRQTGGRTHVTAPPSVNSGEGFSHLLSQSEKED